MKKFLCIIPVLALLLLLPVQAAEPARNGADALTNGDVTAQSAVLMDADTGQVLYAKNMNARRSPASITKIMTGLLVMENCEAGEIITVNETAVQIPWNTSHIALSPGEQLSVDNAMYALMLPSANDAANALAEHTAGSQDEFARMMTARAAELGAKNTSFVNPHGLDDKSHYTTAFDMALITREAIKNPAFMKYFGTGRHTMPPTNVQSEERPFTNQQFMLLPDQWVYSPDVLGGKVGYTQEARHTMSSAAGKDGRTLICVVMGCGVDEKFYDTQTLFDYGFDYFTMISIPKEKVSNLSVPVLEGGQTVGEAVFSAGQELSVLLPSGMDASDIVYKYNLPEALEKGDAPIASVTLSAAGKPATIPDVLLEAPLLASFRYDSAVDEESDSDKDDGGIISRLLYILSIIWLPAALIIFLSAAVFMWRVRLNRRRARKRRRMERIVRERERLDRFGNSR